MDTDFDMPTAIDQKEDLVRVLNQLGIGPLDLIASMHDAIMVLDREGGVVAVLGDSPDESARRTEGVLGKTLGEMFGGQATVHEAAYKRALKGEHFAYEWITRKGRQPLRHSTTASPIRDSSSDVVGAVLVTRNISCFVRDEKRVDAAIAQKTKRLVELEQGIQQLADVIENYRNHAPHEFRSDGPLQQLSSRERQVLDLLGQGYRPRTIAERLHVSPETVRNHLKTMFKKTGTHSQEELIAMLRTSG